MSVADVFESQFQKSVSDVRFGRVTKVNFRGYPLYVGTNRAGIGFANVAIDFVPGYEECVYDVLAMQILIDSNTSIPVAE